MPLQQEVLVRFRGDSSDLERSQQQLAQSATANVTALGAVNALVQSIGIQGLFVASAMAQAAEGTTLFGRAMIGVRVALGQLGMVAVITSLEAALDSFLNAAEGIRFMSIATIAMEESTKKLNVAWDRFGKTIIALGSGKFKEAGLLYTQIFNDLGNVITQTIPKATEMADLSLKIFLNTSDFALKESQLNIILTKNNILIKEREGVHTKNLELLEENKEAIETSAQLTKGHIEDQIILLQLTLEDTVNVGKRRIIEAQITNLTIRRNREYQRGLELVAAIDAQIKETLRAQQEAIAPGLEGASPLGIPTQAEADAALVEYDKQLQAKDALEERAMQQKLDRIQTGADIEEEIADELSAKDAARIRFRIALEQEAFNISTAILLGFSKILSSVGAQDEETRKRNGIISAIVNTAVGITSAFRYLPPAQAIPYAISVASTGAAQIAAILSSNVSGTTGAVPFAGIGLGVGAVETASPDFFRTNQSVTKQDQVVLVVEDFNRAANLVAVKEERASLG